MRPDTSRIHFTAVVCGAWLVVVAALMAGTITVTAPASAQSGPVNTGADEMHAKMRYQGRTCMATHTHTGTSRAGGSEAIARRWAIRDWVDYTVGEYGTAWGSWQRSRAPHISCRERNDG